MRAARAVEARRLLAFGARLHGAALLAVLLAVADRFVVVTFWDDTSLGLYVVALTLATAGLSLVTSAFNILLLPRLAQARTSRRKGGSWARRCATSRCC